MDLKSADLETQNVRNDPGTESCVPCAGKKVNTTVSTCNIRLAVPASYPSAYTTQLVASERSTAEGSESLLRGAGRQLGLATVPDSCLFGTMRARFLRYCDCGRNFSLQVGRGGVEMVLGFGTARRVRFAGFDCICIHCEQFCGGVNVEAAERLVHASVVMSRIRTIVFA
jgi:hypothetical protein